MKKFSVLLILILLFSCKKKDDNPLVIDTSMHSCTTIENVEPYLIGKWKLIKWQAIHYNVNNCTSLGGNEYNAVDYDMDAILEVTPNGVFRTFLLDSLVNESFVTEEFIATSQIGYKLNCQKMQFNFSCLNSLDTISTLEIGDTLKIRNPYLEINFANGSTWSITAVQKYVKIE